MTLYCLSDSTSLSFRQYISGLEIKENEKERYKKRREE
jgi:hypothetical protein